MKNHKSVLIITIICAVLLTLAVSSQRVRASDSLVEECEVQKNQLNLTDNTAVSADSSDVDEEIEEAVSRYFTGRKLLLEGGRSELFSLATLSGIVDDELKHRLLTRETCYSERFSIIQSFLSSEDAFLLLSEHTLEGVVTHEISIAKQEDGRWIILSDRYSNPFDGFTSASHVNPEDIAAIEQLWVAQKSEVLQGNRPFSNSLVLRTNLLNVADGEVGYLEKASDYDLDSPLGNPGFADYSKYGNWYGVNPGKWCAMFVSWCAFQAGVSVNIIPKTELVSVSSSTFSGWGRLYLPASYTPVSGDIFFMQDGRSHTGIVVAVSGNTMLIIDGNAPIPGGTYHQVGAKYYSLTDPLFTGYGHPDYCYGGNHSSAPSYSSDLYTHWHPCLLCETRLDEASHTWINQGTYYQCSVCGRQAAVIPVTPD